MNGPQDRTPGLCSVVCTTYNQAAYVARSLQSIYDQDYRNVEIVVIDDGSTDGNVAALHDALARSPFPHTLLTQENTGNIGHNVNRALAAARGEYVCLLSLDDLLLPDCLSRRIALLQNNPKIMFVANTCNIEIDETDRVTNARFLAPMHDQNLRTAAELLEHEYSHIGTFYIQGAVFRHVLFDAIGGYDEDMTGDDLIIRTKMFQFMMRDPSLTFALLDTPGFAYRKHASNIHLNSFRQLRTVIEWRDRYFPGRPLPDPFRGWALYFFNQCTKTDDRETLDQALAFSPEIRALYEEIRRSWKYRRRSAKNRLRRMLGIRPRA